MIKVYGRATSVNVQAVMWCITELGLEHEREDIGGAYGGTDTPEFLAKNPMGLIPVIEDGAVTLFETPTILRYVIRRYGTHPADPAAAAQLELWADWTRSHFYKPMTYGVFWQLIRTPKNERNHAQFDKDRQEINALTHTIGAQMQGPYINGDTLSIADFAFGTLLHRYFELEFERDAHPAVTAYYEALRQRPAYRAHVMKDPNDLKVEGA